MTRFGLDQPHHDGSERHVSTLEPALGDTVTVWLRVPHATGAERVWLRTTPDAEPHYAEADIDRRTAHETWWRADVTVHNPVTNYRFLLDGGPAGYRNVNGTGVHARTITDAADFRLSAHSPPPRWLADTSFYQVFPDRFGPATTAREWPAWARVSAWGDPVDTYGRTAVTQAFGGDLPGVEQHLDHIAALSADGIYLTPFFPAPSSHRYNADTFGHVDPLLGGDDALARLVKACHDRGIRVIGDLTVNHVGSGHEWFRAAQADPDSEEAAFFFFRHHPDDYEAWFNVPSLPKLDLRSAELRRRLVEGPNSVTAHWVRPPFDLDGWRVDVANMAGRLGAIDMNHTAARAMRATLAEAKPDAYLVGEHCYDASADLAGDGWHGVMNYLAFTRPVWCWLRGDDGLKFLGDPLDLPRLGGAATAASMADVLAAQPWRSSVSGFNLLSSHDTTRFRTICGTAARQVAGAGLLFTMPGVPMVFAGDEVGLVGVDGDGARQPMPWDPSRWDGDVLDAYRALGALRRASPALRHGGLRWVHVDDDVLVYLREARSKRVLVQVARAEHAPVSIDVAQLDAAIGERRFGADDVVERSGQAVLPGSGPSVHVWDLQ